MSAGLIYLSVTGWKDDDRCNTYDELAFATAQFVIGTKYMSSASDADGLMPVLCQQLDCAVSKLLHS